MSKMLAVVRYTVIQHIRNRLYLAVLFFGLAIVGGSMVVSSLAVDVKIRVLLNLGLAGIEFVSALSIIFITVGLILDEMESKSVYLILSHPIHRWQYVIGRYFGTFLAVVLGIVFMATLHLGSLFLMGWHWQTFYVVAVLCSIGKIALISSLALFISLITTSTASSMTLTTFLWVMGHFSSEIKFLGDKSDKALIKIAVQVFYHLTPDLSVFNYRDFFRATLQPSHEWFLNLGFYLIAYVGAMLYLSSWLFTKREY